MDRYDWIIKNGRVIDPGNGIDALADVALADGCIAAVAANLPRDRARSVFEAEGALVVPGLVDLHVHAYHRVTPLGISPDHYCLGRGVTTAVDAGSAGADTLPGFRTFIAERSRTRLLAFLNISRAGLAFAGLGGDRMTPGELDSLKLVDEDRCVRVADENRDLVVGIKVRLSASCADDGKNEAESYERALAAAERLHLPLMVHHSISTVALDDCPGRLRPGDIYTHLYHGFESTIVDAEKKGLHRAVREASARGVLLDTGHGQGSFNWTVAEIAAQQQLWPDTASTDLHSGCCEGPAYDLPTVMTRFLHLGLPLADVIARGTINPARAIGWQDRIGTLGVGREADVAVLSLDRLDADLEDCHLQMRRVRERLKPVAVWRAGAPAEVTQPARFPNPSAISERHASKVGLLVKDCC